MATKKLSSKSSDQFINLCQDLMFKIFFSKNEKLLLSLIQTFIFLPKGKTVKTIKIKNKEKEKQWLEQTLVTLQNSTRYPKFPGGKGIVLDMLATLNTGEIVNIELQTIYHAHLRERILYYWSEVYGSDFKSGAGYGALKPAYSLIFVNFPLFKQSQEILHSFSIRSDKPPYFLLTEHLGITIVDLSRFSFSYSVSFDMVSAWCYFIKSSSCLTDKDCEILVKKNEVFKMAETVLKNLSVDSSVRVLEKLREKWVRDQVSDLAEAEQKGIEKGRAEGQRTLILKLLKSGLDVQTICKATGLSKKEITQLKK